MKLVLFAALLLGANAQAETVLRCPPYYQGGRMITAELENGMPAALLPPARETPTLRLWELNQLPEADSLALRCVYGRDAVLRFSVGKTATSCTFEIPTRTLTCR